MMGMNVPLLGDLRAHGPDAARFYSKRKIILQRGPSVGAFY